MTDAYIIGVGCLSGHGLSWQGLGQKAQQGTSVKTRVPLSEIPANHPRKERLAQRLMSRAALLGHLATQMALQSAEWEGDRSEVGFFMGVGASGGSIEELEAMLDPSMVSAEFSLRAFGSTGLRACNPLYAFQLMNNFSMCHAAILAGVQGVNSAFFSRGGGTVVALQEALHALSDPFEECSQVLVGGSDCATEAVTLAELERQGFLSKGLVPAEGAAVLALSKHPGGAMAKISLCTTAHLTEKVNLLSEINTGVDLALVLTWGRARQEEIEEALLRVVPRNRIVDLSVLLGETLAASPALAWAVAVDLLQGTPRRILVLNCGIDEELGAVILEAPKG